MFTKQSSYICTKTGIFSYHTLEGNSRVGLLGKGEREREREGEREREREREERRGEEKG